MSLTHHLIGLLGRQILSTLTKAGLRCHGLVFSRVSPGLTSLDLNDGPATKAFIISQSPTHIIHAAAQRFPDKVEADPEAAVRLNVESSKNIALACKVQNFILLQNTTVYLTLQDVGARMIYISTDYVFDGSPPPYFPDNKPNPLNRYGETKLAGERAVLSVEENFLVLRIPVLYGGVTTLGESAVTVLLDVIRKKVPVKMSSYEVRCPSHTRDVARILLDILRQEPTGGVYHWCGRDKLSKWEMCQIISEEFSLDISHVEEVKGGDATPRPRDVELDRTKLERLGISHHTDFKNGMLEELRRFL